MGFGLKLKKAFGLVSEEDNEFDDIISSAQPRSLSVSSTTATAQQTDDQMQETTEAPPADDPQLAADIFETVVETFNQSLPAFIRDSIDPKAQREFLYGQLKQSVRDHLAHITERANRHSEAQWQQRQTSLRVEVETYKEKLRQLEEKQNEAKQAQLSAERQKRALSERVHDLESKILKFEADAEQSDLEKKSLLNKLKVASVHDDDNEALRAELETLRAELAKARSQKTDTPAEPQIQTVDNPETERLLAEAIAENARLKTEAQRIGNDHKKELSEAYDVAKELEAKLHLASKNVKELQRELDHANEELRVAEEIQNTIEKFEEIKQRQEARIERLKAENDELKKSLEKAGTLDTEPESVLHTEAIEEPADVTTPETVSAATPVAETILTPASTILFDDVLDDTSWVSATPTPSSAETKPVDEFGYKPPKKRPAPPADDATRQLSLF